MRNESISVIQLSFGSQVTIPSDPQDQERQFTTSGILQLTIQSIGKEYLKEKNLSYDLFTEQLNEEDSREIIRRVACDYMRRGIAIPKMLKDNRYYVEEGTTT